MRQTIAVECEDCKGTGLFKGVAERGGAAVVCSCCHGTGKREITYNKFEGRKEIAGVTRVFEGVSGYLHSDEDITTKDGKTLHYSQYGCSYDAWKSGVNPTPMEELYCPLEYHSNTSVNGKPFFCGLCAEDYSEESIKDCYFYDRKEMCWKEWHNSR